MRMLRFLSSPFFIIFIQFSSCEGIYNVYLLHSSTLFSQVRTFREVGAVGQPGLEKEPVSRAVVLVTTRRLQMMSVQTVRIIQNGALQSSKFKKKVIDYFDKSIFSFVKMSYSSRNARKIDL